MHKLHVTGVAGAGCMLWPQVNTRLAELKAMELGKNPALISSCEAHRGMTRWTQTCSGGKR